MSFEIHREDINALALGSSLLGCGGGGNAYYGQLVARQTISPDTAVRVIDVEELARDQLAVSCAGIGAPLVLLEKGPSLIALRAGFEAIEKSLGGRVGAFVAAEVGGLQSLLPLIMAALTGKPLLDGDGMGRAFPELQMCTFAIYGTRPGLPLVISGDQGLLFKLGRLPFALHSGGRGRFAQASTLLIERLLRRYCARKGGLIYMTNPFDCESMQRTLVRGSIRLALDIGLAVEEARKQNADPVAAVLGASGGRLMFRGKTVDLERRFRGGHDWGTLAIEGLEDYRGMRASIAFKNEYLVLTIGARPVLTVPDLITLVEAESGIPITSDLARPGLRVSVVGMQSSPLLRSPEALAVVGPRAFGYELDFIPLN